MFCAQCGAHADDGAHFCNACGAPLQVPGGTAYQQSVPPVQPAQKGSRRSSSAKQQDPYALQIKQLKLQIRQLKLDLKQINTGMSSIRSNYNQTAAFVPRGLFREGDKMIEDLRLRGPQKQKQDLQQQIMQLEQELLSLQQQQQQWQQG
jgi:predicted amidophosphoribosyltransferase